MQTKDHLALGRVLLEQSGCAVLFKHQRAFLFGCVAPDYNPATYLRGITVFQNLRGHNAENSFAHVVRGLTAIRSDGLRTAGDFFTLGTLLHYIADAFTSPHNSFWHGSLLRHAVYESQLHEKFAAALRTATAGAPVPASGWLPGFLTDRHEAYRAAPRLPETDCRYILSVCSGVLARSLCYIVSDRTEAYGRKGALSRACVNYNGLV